MYFWYNGYVTYTSKRHWFILGVLLLILVGLAGGGVFAQDQGGRAYFPNTGHWVRGDFKIKYYSVPNPQVLFGDPITDAFLDEATGVTVQYFQKVRFEHHPAAIPALRVRISPLGEFLYEKGDPLPVATNFAGCEFYPNVSPGFHICYDFLAFFEENGGVSQFGYPISNFEIHDDFITQYFQRAKFEWRPSSYGGNWVSLANLGEEYFQVQGENPRWLRPNLDGAPLLRTNDIKVRAFSESPIMPFSGTQTLYVIVQNQANIPVENAKVVFVVRYPDKPDQTFDMKLTDQRGISSLQFPVKVGSPGIVEILVNAKYQEFESQTKTSFQVWW